MRIAHLSDLHVTCLKRLLGYEKAMHRHKVCLSNTFTTLKHVKPDAIVIAGDIFDHHNPDKNETAVATDFILSCSKIAKVLIVAGNHEYDTEGTALDYLESIQRIYDRIIVATRSYKYVRIKKQWFLLMPFRCFPTKVPNESVIGISHFPIANSVKDSSGGTLHSGIKLKSVFEYVKRMKMDWLLMGDIHEQQKFKNVVYSGSILQTKFNESETKGFNVIEGKDVWHLPVESPKLITVDNPKDAKHDKNFYHVKGRRFLPQDNVVKTSFTIESKRSKTFNLLKLLLNMTKGSVKEKRILRAYLKRFIPPNCEL